MKETMKIVHLSDLHFGRDVPDLAKLLLADLQSINPDLVVVSGDFTQHATRLEFEEAETFLKDISFPTFAVPGNHDIPRYNVRDRFMAPFKRYRDYIAPDIEPAYHNNLVCIAGLNTARPAVPHWNWANGAISKQQLSKLQTHYKDCGSPFKICVMHHPVWKVLEAQLDVVVFGGRPALDALGAMKVNLVLSGHVHHAAVQALPVNDDHAIIFLSAATAMSDRLRGQSNGYNIITVGPENVIIDIRGYNNNRFEHLQGFEQKYRP